MEETKDAVRAPESVPELIHPTCPSCGADPLILKRLRHDFPDGVVVEILFCAKLECRAAIGAQIVGIEKPTIPTK
jgi:hypothetical protein